MRRSRRVAGCPPPSAPPLCPATVPLPVFPCRGNAHAVSASVGWGVVGSERRGLAWRAAAHTSRPQRGAVAPVAVAAATAAAAAATYAAAAAQAATLWPPAPLVVAAPPPSARRRVAALSMPQVSAAAAAEATASVEGATAAAAVAAAAAARAADLAVAAAAPREGLTPPLGRLHRAAARLCRCPTHRRRHAH